MMERIGRIASLLLVGVLCCVCQKEDAPVTTAPPEQKFLSGDYVLPLMETTDIHGYIVYTDNSDTHYRLAYIADKARDIRGRGDQYRKDRLLLLDGGDLYQGATVSNLQSGRPVYISMDKMDYDAVALGNHEFDWDIEALVDADATLPAYEWNGLSYGNDVPIVCSNLYRNGSRVSWTKDYVIVEKTAVHADGATIPVKIGIVGLAEDYAGSIMSSKFDGKGYSITEDYQAANRIAASLEADGRCDATILLLHGAADDAAGKLGQGSAFDLVLGGHSHQYMSGKTSWGLPYLQGGRYCEHYAYADLVFHLDSDGSLSFEKVSNQKTPSVESLRDIHRTAGQNEADLEEDILSVSDEALSAVSEQMNDVIGYITVNATSYYLSGSDERAAVISNWMCDITRRIGDADVAFVNGGGVRTSLPLNGQSRRNITVSNVYEMFPFNNTIYVYRITYAELLQVFEYAMTSGGKSLFSRMTGLDCHFSGYTLRSLEKDGTEIYRDRKWTGDWASREVILAVSEYLATSQRVDYYTGKGNPLLEWNKTSRLLVNDLVDNENAIRVLRAEAAASGGHLWIDTAPHFLSE